MAQVDPNDLRAIMAAIIYAGLMQASGAQSDNCIACAVAYADRLILELERVA